MNWSLVVGYAVSGALVSWPVFIAGLIWNAREGKRHTEARLTEQTADIKDFAEDLTKAQTAELRRRRISLGRGQGRTH